MRRLNRFKDFVYTLPKEINQKLVDGYRVKLFSKIKDSLEKKKLSLKKEKLELKKLIRENRVIDIKNLSINNSFYTPILGA